MRGSFPFAALEGQDDGVKQATTTANADATANANAEAEAEAEANATATATATAKADVATDGVVAGGGCGVCDRFPTDASNVQVRNTL